MVFSVAVVVNRIYALDGDDEKITVINPDDIPRQSSPRSLAKTQQNQPTRQIARLASSVVGLIIIVPLRRRWWWLPPRNRAELALVLKEERAARQAARQAAQAK